MEGGAARNGRFHERGGRQAPDATGNAQKAPGTQADGSTRERPARNATGPEREGRRPAAETE
eukprot:2318872-Pyramimonas_sp.AAC.1